MCDRFGDGKGVMVDELCPLRGHSACVYSVALSPDGTRVVTGSKDRLAIVWNVETGAVVSCFVGLHRLLYHSA